MPQGTPRFRFQEPVNTDKLKRAAALESARYIEDGMELGLGTGSTIAYLLDHIGERRAAGDWESIRGVPTSEATARRARELGIPLCTLDECPDLDLTIDGADEVDPGLNLIKGLGGALLREKIVASVSSRLIIVADETKLVERLGTKAPLPVEVVPFGANVQVRALNRLGADPVLRRASDGATYLSDGGNVIYDCHFSGGILDGAELEAQLNNVPGVVENGLFIGRADTVIVASADGTRTMERKP